MKSRTIGAGEFKAKCLKLMDEVQTTGEEIIVTKRGKPVVKIVPEREAAPPIWPWLEMAGSVKFLGDIISPIEGLDWTGDEHNINGHPKKRAATIKRPRRTA